MINGGFVSKCEINGAREVYDVNISTKATLEKRPRPSKITVTSFSGEDMEHVISPHNGE